MTPEEIDEQKDIEFYASSVDAWFGTSLEHDKSLLALSAGGIGLLLTLLTTVGLSSAESLVLYIAAIACYLVALLLVLFIFRQNRSYIERIIKDRNVTHDPLLSKADKAALAAFGLGVIFTAIIGVGAAVQSYTSKESAMAKEPPIPSPSTPIRKSVDGAAMLRPSVPALESFNGATNLAPKPSATAAPRPTVPPPAATPQPNVSSTPSAPAVPTDGSSSGE